jgi:hypothetical protein
MYFLCYNTFESNIFFFYNKCSEFLHCLMCA